MKTTASEQRKTFRNNYLAVAIITLFFSLGANAQGGYLPTSRNYGSGDQRRVIDSTLFYPTGCGNPSLRSVDLKHSALYYDSCNHRQWIYDPKRMSWDTSKGGSSFDSSSISNRINLKNNISDTAAMLNPYLRISIAAMQYATIANLNAAIAKEIADSLTLKVFIDANLAKEISDSLFLKGVINTNSVAIINNLNKEIADSSLLKGLINTNTSNIATNTSSLLTKANKEIKNAMITVACGNSISAQSQYNGTNWSTKSEIQFANMLSGAPMIFKPITATARSDMYGVYGYSGQTLTTIIADMDAQWFTPLNTAGVVPDLVIGQALLENDIAQSHTVAQMTADLTSWLRNVQNRWPQAKIHLITPRPSFSYNTPTLVSNYQAMRSYILGLDDGLTIFVSRGDTYEDPLAPALPQSYGFTGSISGSTLTVTSITGTPLKVGTQIMTAGQVDYGRISYFGTGTGGTGTYILTASNTVASTSLLAAPYTDFAVHPNARGALILARVQAATLARIGTKWKLPYGTVSTNMALDGTATATGTNVSGTVPTSVTIGGSAGATWTATAEQPGFLQSVVVNPASAPPAANDLGTFNFGAYTLSTSQVSPFIQVQIVSGAANLRSLQLYPRITDGSGNNFHPHIFDNTNDAEADWQDGDILTIRQPPQVANGTITSVQNYVKQVPKLAGGTTVFRVLSQGVGLTGSAASVPYLPIAGGTVTGILGLGGDSTNGIVIKGIGGNSFTKTIQTYASSALALQPLGSNVLIGTSTNSTYKLDVNGGIRAQGASNPSLIGGVLSLGTGNVDGMLIDATGAGSTAKTIQTYSSSPLALQPLGTNTVIGGTTNITSAILNVISTVKGAINAPVMSTTQVNAIASPVDGLMAYANDSHRPRWYNGTSWRTVADSADATGGGLVYPNTTTKYLNGYGAFATLNSDSLTEGATKLFYTTARDAANVHLAGTETISGAKTFSSLITSSISAGGNIYSATNGTDVNLIFTLTAPGAGTKFARIYSTTATAIQLGQSTNKIGIGGISSPTSALHLPGGVASASGAPLKLTAGTNLTTTEAGAVEYDGTHLYFTATNGGTRYQLDLVTDTLNTNSTVAKRGLSGHITATGLIVPGATNQAALMGNGTTKTLISATYTPTATAVTNVTSTSSIGVFQYTRIGNILTVSGTMSVTPTSGATQTIYKISLPVAATSTTLSSVAGVASFYDASGNMVSGNIDGSNSGYATITTKSQGAGAILNGSFHFTYVIDPANP